MQALRIFLFRIHAWIGLNTCMVLAVIFASGTVLVFGTEIEAVFYVESGPASNSSGPPVSLGAVFDSVQATYPDARIAAIQRDTVGAMIGDQTILRTAWGERVSVWTDRSTGAVLGASPDEGFRKILLEFHETLFTGHMAGKLAVTVFAFSLLASLFTGLIAYRRFWRGLRSLPARGAGQRRWWGAYHRLAAVWALPFLSLVALTGIYYFLATFNLFPANDPKSAPPVARDGALPSGFGGAELDRAIAAAKEAVPGLEVTTVSTPWKNDQGITVVGHSGAVPVHVTKIQIAVDPVDYRVLSERNWSNASLKTRLKNMADLIHRGEWGGSVSRVLWLIFGVLGTSLMVSGAIVYGARVARLPSSGGGAPLGSQPLVRRVWRGMFITKWGLPVLAVAVAAVGIYRFGIKEEGWWTVWPQEAGNVQVQLRVKGALREGEPLPLLLQVKEEGVGQLEVRFGDSPPQVVTIKGQGNSRAGRTTVTPGRGRNELSVAVPGAEGAARVWVLGRPVL